MKLPGVIVIAVIICAAVGMCGVEKVASSNSKNNQALALELPNGQLTKTGKSVYSEILSEVGQSGPFCFRGDGSEPDITGNTDASGLAHFDEKPIKSKCNKTN